jgi:peptidoglycan-N-acetylglucosamine deacetylase
MADVYGGCAPRGIAGNGSMVGRCAMRHRRKHARLLLAVVVVSAMVAALGAVLYKPLYAGYRKAIASCVEWGNSYKLSVAHLDDLLERDAALMSQARLIMAPRHDDATTLEQKVRSADAVLSSVSKRRQQAKTNPDVVIDCNSSRAKFESKSIVGDYRAHTAQAQRDIFDLDNAFDPLCDIVFDRDAGVSNARKGRLAAMLPGLQNLYDDSGSSASAAARASLSRALTQARADMNGNVRYSTLARDERDLYAVADVVIRSSNSTRHIDCSRQHCVALTFDDGTDTVNSPKVVETLRSNGTSATFFLMGQKMQGASGQIARRLPNEGFSIGSHTWSHEGLPRIMDKHDEGQQLDDAANAITSATGRAITLVRPPYGAVNEASRRYVADHFGAAIAAYGVDSYDWASGATAQSVERKVMAQVEPGSIVLLHDIHPQTVAALPRIIAKLKAQDYRFVTIPELTGQYPRAGSVYYSRTNILGM